MFSFQDPKKVFSSSLDGVGFTPLVELKNISKIHGIKCKLFGKCEFYNAFGSVKDRIGFRMVVEAEREGKIKPGCTIIEPTSGNTGIGIAAAAAVKGYRCIIVIPEKMSHEKINTLKALGAEIHRTPTAAAFDHPGTIFIEKESNIRVAQQLQKEIPNSIILDQYRNPYNPVAHYDSTGEEIIDQCDGKIDYVVISVGTGGTMTGISRKVKEKVPGCKIIGVDPEGSILAHGRSKTDVKTNFYEVEGIGYDFFPTVFDDSLIDEWIIVDDKKALNCGRELIKKEALLAGGSSGSALYAAIQICKSLDCDKTVVVILPDSIRNYMSKFLCDDWMIERGFMEHKIAEPFKTLMEVPVSILELVYVKPADISDPIFDVFERLTQNFENQIPVVDNENFVGVVDISFMNNLIEGKTPQNHHKVKRFINREYKKVIMRDANLFHLFYMYKTSNNVIFLEKEELESQTKLSYRGQLSKSSFYQQIYCYFKQNNIVSEVFDSFRLH